MIEQVLSLLSEAAPRLTALTADLAPSQIHTPGTTMRGQ